MEGLSASAALVGVIEALLRGKQVERQVLVSLGEPSEPVASLEESWQLVQRADDAMGHGAPLLDGPLGARLLALLDELIEDGHHAIRNLEAFLLVPFDDPRRPLNRVVGLQSRAAAQRVAWIRIAIELAQERGLRDLAREQADALPRAIEHNKGAEEWVRRVSREADEMLWLELCGATTTLSFDMRGLLSDVESIAASCRTTLRRQNPATAAPARPAPHQRDVIAPPRRRVRREAPVVEKVRPPRQVDARLDENAPARSVRRSSNPSLQVGATTEPRPRRSSNPKLPAQDSPPQRRTSNPTMASAGGVVGGMTGGTASNAALADGAHPAEPSVVIAYDPVVVTMPAPRAQLVEVVDPVDAELGKALREDADAACRMILELGARLDGDHLRHVVRAFPPRNETEERGFVSVVDLLSKRTNHRGRELAYHLVDEARKLAPSPAFDFAEAEVLLARASTDRAGDAERAWELASPIEASRAGLPRERLLLLLADALLRRRGDREALIEKAIETLRETLTILKTSPKGKAARLAHRLLGDCHRERVKGKRADNLETALAEYKEASLALRRDDAADEWARCRLGIGVCHALRQAGDRDENTKRAIDNLTDAVGALDDATLPFEANLAGVNLGRLLHRRRQGGDHERARELFERALKYFSPRDNPIEQRMAFDGLAELRSWK